MRKCSSCHAKGATFRCTVCKLVFYCTSDCQRSDWPFHRRLCVKPAAAPAAAEPAAPAASVVKPVAVKPSPVVTSSPAASDDDEVGAAAPGGASAASRATASAKGVSSPASSEDEDVMAAVAKGACVRACPGPRLRRARAAAAGYRYFARQLPEAEQTLIGDIRPRRIDTESKVRRAATMRCPHGRTPPPPAGGEACRQRGPRDRRCVRLERDGGVVGGTALRAVVPGAPRRARPRPDVRCAGLWETHRRGTRGRRQLTAPSHAPRGVTESRRV